MAVERLRQTTRGNRYLHRDFHGALSAGIEYLDCRYGEEAVCEYLRRFARSFYAPVIRKVRRRGLPALKEHFERVYRDEDWPVDVRLSEGRMTVAAESSPAVLHMRERGYPVARLFRETVRTVNEALCEDTDIKHDFLSYDAETGSSVARFTLRTGRTESNRDKLHDRL